jgi:hypothetical protein
MKELGSRELVFKTGLNPPIPDPYVQFLLEETNEFCGVTKTIKP